MNRRGFFGLVLGAAVAPAIPTPEFTGLSPVLTSDPIDRGLAEDGRAIWLVQWGKGMEYVQWVAV